MCRVRKVKCDEAKPFCMRCVKTGRKCDGYFALSRPHSGRLNSLSPSPDFESADEVRAFDYYRSRSALALGNAVDGDFWSGSILKLCLTEPAVRHAVLALSSLHECVTVKAETGRDIGKDFAFLEYGKSMSVMRKWKSRDEPSIPLLVCLLFTGIEFLLDHEGPSQLHISQGRQVLHGLENSNSPSMDMIKRELVPIYARLSLASFLFANRPAPIPSHLKVAPSLPAEFTSFHEARNHLYHLLDEALAFTTQARPSIYNPTTTTEEMEAAKAIQQQVLSDMCQWHAAFTVLSTCVPLDKNWTTTGKLLMMYYHAATVWVSTALQANEVAYDSHTTAFASIISLADSIMNSRDPKSDPSVFNFETELIAPVYWTVTKCRHPLLRRAALKLLMRDDMKERKENLWWGREVIAIASRVIEVEEGEAGFPAALYTDQGRQTYWDLEQSDVQESQLAFEAPPVSVDQPPSRYPPPYTLTLQSGDSIGDIFDNDEIINPAPGSERRFYTPPPLAPTQPAFITPAMGPSSFKSPFDIPESRRVKNATVGPRQGSGIWTDIFLEPPPEQMEWTVRREFLKL